MKRTLLQVLVALTVAFTAPAHAHLVDTGFGAFYDGIAHLAVTPTDLLVVVALALFAGQRGTRTARAVIFALPLAWWIGGLTGARWPVMTALPLLTTLSFALAGALVALNARICEIGVIVFTIITGLLHGLMNGATMASGGASGLALSGAVSAIFFLTTVLSAEVTALPAGWPGIAVRVAGSWIAATGLLMLGWLVHAAR